VYYQNGLNIREEYSMFSDEEWHQGRMKFLLGMLCHGRIYWDNVIEEKYLCHHTKSISAKQTRLSSKGK